ncbi:MAG: hypothetical protein Q4A01_10915 [Coriobacteriales bacterium]|nr:hypothetical protein [Coriobacteriales bacterium]
MSVAAVSGRMDRKNRQAGKVLATRAGKTVLELRRERMRAFLGFVESAPPAPDWFVSLTDAEMNHMIADGKAARLKNPRTKEGGRQQGLSLESATHA